MAQRGSAYPSMKLKDAIEKSRVILSELGRGQNKRELVRKSLGYNSESGPAKRTMASLSYYGLLERIGDEYKLSSLSNRILFPISDEDARAAKAEAVLRPDLYKKLYDQYKGQVLPASLSNILVVKHNISSAESAVKNFKESLRYSGLLSDTDTILDEGGDSTASPESDDAKNTGGENLPQNSRADALRRLPSGIVIAFPDALDFAVMTGEFGAEIKALEIKAQGLLQAVGDEGKDPENEKTGT